MEVTFEESFEEAELVQWDNAEQVDFCFIEKGKSKKPGLLLALVMH